MDRLKHMKETLMCAVEMQMCDLPNADTQELGEAIDMIKDLEEAIYYCTIVKAMHGEEEEKNQRYYEDRHYYEGGSNGRGSSSSSNGQSSSSGRMSGNRNYYDWDYPMTMRDSYYAPAYMERDPKEGRSPMNRKMYMEAREHNRDKASQLRELEKYMSELSQDIIEMIQEATPEEKQYLEKKISALATKIGQMK